MCGQNTFRAMAPNANIQQSQITGNKIPAGHTFDRMGAGLFRQAIKDASPKTKAIFEGAGRQQAPPVLRSLSSSGNSSGLSIRRTAGKTRSAQASSRSQSKSRRFSTR